MSYYFGYLNSLGEFIIYGYRTKDKAVYEYRKVKKNIEPEIEVTFPVYSKARADAQELISKLLRVDTK